MEIEIISLLLDNGVLGIIAAYLMWLLNKQQKREDLLVDRLTGVIKNNTVAFAKFEAMLKNIEEGD